MAQGKDKEEVNRRSWKTVSKSGQEWTLTTVLFPTRCLGWDLGLI